MARLSGAVGGRAVGPVDAQAIARQALPFSTAIDSLTLANTARRLGISKGTLRNWIKRGEFVRSSKVTNAKNSTVLFRIVDIQRWLEERERKVTN